MRRDGTSREIGRQEMFSAFREIHRLHMDAPPAIGASLIAQALERDRCLDDVSVLGEAPFRGQDAVPRPVDVVVETAAGRDPFVAVPRAGYEIQVVPVVCDANLGPLTRRRVVTRLRLVRELERWHGTPFVLAKNSVDRRGAVDARDRQHLRQ